MYQKDHRFKDRIMLVDEDLLKWFTKDPLARMPSRLAMEYDMSVEGYNSGPLMKQETYFDQLWRKNAVIKHQLLTKMLADIQHNHFEHTNTPSFCYCHDNMPQDGVPPKNVVECTHCDCEIKYFHKSCVKKLGFEKVSRWLCIDCEDSMRALAYRTLRRLGYKGVPDKGADLYESFLKYKATFNMSDTAMEKMRTRVEAMGGGHRMAGIVAMAMSRMT
jgi:hypothetical protein